MAVNSFAFITKNKNKTYNKKKHVVDNLYVKIPHDIHMICRWTFVTILMLDDYLSKISLQFKFQKDKHAKDNVIHLKNEKIMRHIQGGW